MPSSSTHSTTFEAKILDYFMMAGCNLYHNHMYHVFGRLAQRFAILIDLTESELVSCMKTASSVEAPAPMPFEIRQNAEHLWHRVAIVARLQKRCERIWVAGNHVLDVSAELSRMDRVREAAEFQILGVELHEMALSEFEKEKSRG